MEKGITRCNFMQFRSVVIEQHGGYSGDLASSKIWTGFISNEMVDYYKQTHPVLFNFLIVIIPFVLYQTYFCVVGLVLTRVARLAVKWWAYGPGR